MPSSVIVDLPPIQVVFSDDDVIMCFRKVETQIGDLEIKDKHYHYN